MLKLMVQDGYCSHFFLLLTAAVTSGGGLTIEIGGYFVRNNATRPEALCVKNSIPLSAFSYFTAHD